MQSTPEDIKKYNINILPLQISTSERTYQDDGNDLKTNEIYELIEKEIPKTSMPNLGRAVELLERLKEEGYTHALAIHISKGLSGTFEMVHSLKEKADEIGIKLEVIDSNSISMGLGFLVLKAAAMLEESETLNKTIETITKLKEKTKVYFVVKLWSTFVKVVVSEESKAVWEIY
jgi:DegV family protein with EDD domain